mmetsp:Transcript_34331/g.81882  ORF Transcript_34331/g.81882 Transcript_34331/m.81882 type:complete len:167 (-) Transcript_34331:7-507(-)
MGLLSGMGWSATIQLCRSSFSKARNISTAELSEMLDNNKTQVLLLDSRKKEEFDVSHMKGAIYVGENGEAPEMDEAIRKFQSENAGKEQIIACYCSVGYRSSRLAEKLQTERGLSNVVNVEGSIFKWANEGREVWRQEQRLETPVAHPYNSVWGQLLDSDKRAARP